MAWNKKGGAKISRQQAMNMIDGFQKQNKDHVRSIYYDKEALQSVLDTPGCAGVSIYFAKGDTGPTLVLIPVDENGKNIWEDEKSKGGFTAMDVGNACPPYCP